MKNILSFVCFVLAGIVAAILAVAWADPTIAHFPGVALGGTTNVLTDSGSALTYNGSALGGGSDVWTNVTVSGVTNLITPSTGNGFDAATPTYLLRSDGSLFGGIGFTDDTGPDDASWWPNGSFISFMDQGGPATLQQQSAIISDASYNYTAYMYETRATVDNVTPQIDSNTVLLEGTDPSDGRFDVIISGLYDPTNKNSNGTNCTATLTLSGSLTNATKALLTFQAYDGPTVPAPISYSRGGTNKFALNSDGSVSTANTNAWTFKTATTSGTNNLVINVNGHDYTLTAH